MKKHPVKNNEKKTNKIFNDHNYFTNDEDILDLDFLDTSIKDAWLESFENNHYDTEDLDYRYFML